MMLRRLAALSALAAAFTTSFVSDDAQACGGCFVGDQESTVVTGHRMALSVSTHQTVLWDQIEYTGNPEEFSWVLPIKPGATLDVANDAFFEVLEAGTATVVGEPQQPWCGDEYGYDGDYYGGEMGSSGGDGFGCGSGDFEAAMGSADEGYGATGGGYMNGDPNAPPEKQDVDIVSQGTVGPYETVTLSTEVPGALNDWLGEHGYNVPEDIQPIIDAYVAEGFDFIALRLVPGEQVSAMQPVRVTTPGSSFTLPLRLVAAGTGAKTKLTLFVLGEGRYEPQNFFSSLIDESEVVWDFETSSSNYSELRAEHYKFARGGSWVTTYARQSSLFYPVEDNIAPMFDVTYNIGSKQVSTLAEAYVRQGMANGDEEATLDCLSAFNAGYDNPLVVPTCETPDDCEPISDYTIPADQLACGSLDDVSVAVTGMHMNDVWITRLDAELPRSALSEDLILQASDEQNIVHNRFVPLNTENACPDDTSVSGAALAAPNKRGGPSGLVPLTLAAFGLVWWMRRRRLDDPTAL